MNSNTIRKLLNNSFFLIFILIFAIFIIYTRVVDTYTSISKNNEVKTQYDQLNREYASTLKERKKLEKKANKEKYYRKEYQLSKKGEILFEFPEEDDQNENTQS